MSKELATFIRQCAHVLQAHDHTLGLARRSATVALLRSLQAGAQN